MLIVAGLVTVACSAGNAPSVGDGVDAQQSGDSVDLWTLVERFAEFRGHIVFEPTSEDGTPPSTLYLDPPRYRMDYGGMLSSIVTPDGSYTCSTLGEGYCTDNDAYEDDIAFGKALEFHPGVIAAMAEGFRGADVEVSGDRIAARDATCFTGSSSAGSATLCFDIQGALLLLSEVSFDEPIEIRATRVSNDVSDADFELPYEIREPTLEDLFPTE